MSNELILVVAIFLGPIVLLGVAGLWLSFRYLRPLTAKLGFSSLNRSMTRNLLFAGVVSDDPEIVAATRKFRMGYAVLLVLFLLFTAVFFGVITVAFFTLFIGIKWLLAKEVDCAAVTQ